MINHKDWKPKSLKDWLAVYLCMVYENKFQLDDVLRIKGREWVSLKELQKGLEQIQNITNKEKNEVNK